MTIAIIILFSLIVVQTVNVWRWKRRANKGYLAVHELSYRLADLEQANELLRKENGRIFQAWCSARGIRETDWPDTIG